MSQAAIELKGIACTFVSDDSGTLSTYTAVKNVDLTVADGEFVSVVGHRLRQIHTAQYERGTFGAQRRYCQHLR